MPEGQRAGGFTYPLARPGRRVYNGGYRRATGGPNERVSMTDNYHNRGEQPIGDLSYAPVPLDVTDLYVAAAPLSSVDILGSMVDITDAVFEGIGNRKDSVHYWTAVAELGWEPPTALDLRTVGRALEELARNLDRMGSDGMLLAESRFVREGNYFDSPDASLFLFGLIVRIAIDTYSDFGPRKDWQ